MPDLTHDSSPRFWRIALGWTLLCTAVVLFTIGVPSLELGRFANSLKWRLAGLGGLLLLAGLVGLFLLSWTPVWSAFLRRLEPAARGLRRLGLLNLLPLAAAAGVVALLVYMPVPNLFKERGLFLNPWARLALIGLMGAVGAPFLKALAPKLELPEALIGAVLLVAAVYQAFMFAKDISVSPLSLGWSEGSRYYYSSLFFSPEIYGQRLAWPFLHPSRYLLQSIPYIIPGLPLLAHRIWQVLLWLGMSALTGGLLAKRLGFARRERAWVFTGWAFLFVFQGPVYYHLLVPVCLILAGFDSRRFWRSLLVVALASAWAGISRINWFPVPALLALSFYLLETRYGGAGGLWRYFRKPLAWGVMGVVTALAAQALYVVISHQGDIDSFGSSFTSDLLWYRLMPTPTYPYGILPMTIGLSLPLLVLIAGNLGGKKLHPLRALGLGGTLLVLLAAGLVVSTKIGGGSNLHNMDSYLVMLLLWGGMFGSVSAGGRFAPEEPGARTWSPWPLLVAAVLAPLYPLVLNGGPIPEWNVAQAWQDVGDLRQEVQPAAQAGGKVLFIWQRHLLTFGLIDGVQLEPDYETVELMEMAMSNNRPYLEQFYKDLREHRYAMIVAMVQNPFEQNADRAFAEENNLWVQRVARPILAYYREQRVLEYSGVQILVPK
jgi:hypothetical protein